MFEVIPIQTKTEQEALAARVGAEYLPDALAYRADAEGEFVGMCQFRLDGDGGHMLTLDSLPGHEDFQPMFVMGRAALNFMELCGAETACYEAPVRDRVLVGAIGFREDENGKLTVNIKGFFDHPCQHHETNGNA